jgi:hypothetical protein
MSVVTLFYKLFWSSPACRNLFLLSKVELLDSHEVKLDDKNRREVSFPRIILSNFDPEALDYSKIDIRAEKNDVRSEGLIAGNISNYEPLITNFLKEMFGKSTCNAFDRFFLEKEMKTVLRTKANELQLKPDVGKDKSQYVLL